MGAPWLLHPPVGLPPVLPPGLRTPPGLPPPDVAPPAASCEPCKSTVAKKEEVVDLKDVPRTRTLTPNSFAWVVDARKLSSSDKVIVSPRFEFASSSGPAGFRVIMYPKDISHRTGRESFKRSRGFGSITVKSESSLFGDVSIDVTVGQRGCREPVLHNFSQEPVSQIPDVWNFRKEVDEATQTVEIHVSIKSQ